MRIVVIAVLLVMLCGVANATTYVIKDQWGNITGTIDDGQPTIYGGRY